MSESENNGGKAAAGIAGGAGLGLMAILRVCSHEAGVVDDVARLGARGAEAAGAAGAGVGDDLARVAGHAGDAADELAQGAGRAAAEVAPEGGALSEVAEHAGHLVDAADVGSAVYELASGPGGGDDGVWLGEPPSEAVLRAGRGRHGHTTVGFVARLVKNQLYVGASATSLDQLTAWRRAADDVCWLYLGPADAPVERALGSGSASEGEVPVQVEGYSARVLGG